MHNSGSLIEIKDCIVNSQKREFHQGCDGETRILYNDTKMERVKLNNGNVMPTLGLGYWIA